ncbi:MAG: SDR family NAD(P)-dependent oxidoreductase [Bacillota bacterium]|nr:SDR family NAD(P)-dependent oxidoreductase [Bacillota bacterium]
MTAADSLLIAGASGDLGLAITRRLLPALGSDYSDIWLHAHRHPERILAALSAAELDDPRVHIVSADLSSRRQVLDWLEREQIRAGQLVYAAGIASVRQIQDLDEAEWQALTDANVSGALWLIQGLLPLMLARRRGSIVLLSSIWGRAGASCEAAYAATKAALIALTRSLAAELGPSGIRVNCLAPGLIDSAMNAHLSTDEMREFCQNIPLGRPGRPEEVAAACAWLLGDEAAYVTGLVLGVDGGLVVS